MAMSGNAPKNLRSPHRRSGRVESLPSVSKDLHGFPIQIGPIQGAVVLIMILLFVRSGHRMHSQLQQKHMTEI